MAAPLSVSCYQVTKLLSYSAPRAQRAMAGPLSMACYQVTYVTKLYSAPRAQRVMAGPLSMACYQDSKLLSYSVTKSPARPTCHGLTSQYGVLPRLKVTELLSY